MKNVRAFRAIAAAALTVAAGLAGPVAAADMTADQILATSGVTNDTSFCGTKNITLGIHDGFGINGWSKSSMAAVRSEAAKCPNVKQVVRIGQGDLQKSISDVNGLVAEGIDALVIIPDFGKAQLPSLKAASKAGVKVVAWAADPGGKPGEDYVAYVDWDQVSAGRAWAEWTAKAIGGKGNVVFLGGPAGNPVSANSLAGIKTAMAKYPGITMLTGYDDWHHELGRRAPPEDSDWTPGEISTGRRHHQRQRRFHRSRGPTRVRGGKQAARSHRDPRGQRVRLRIQQAQARKPEARIWDLVGSHLDGPGRRAQGDRRRTGHREP
jgi:ABC-type sugar transport system substrate-binding protein